MSITFFRRWLTVLLLTAGFLKMLKNLALNRHLLKSIQHGVVYLKNLGIGDILAKTVNLHIFFKPASIANAKI